MIFGSLESAGFPRSLQNILLPEWVTPEVLSDATVSSEIAAILAKRLGLRASTLFAANPRVELLRRRDIKYKRAIPKKSKNLTAATSIAVSVAESVASACRVAFVPFVGSAANLRQEVLASFPGKWLGLRNLLMTCWSHGIPVVYLAELGQGVAKMDGMVVYTSDRPVIILSKTSPLWAWQLFILAHEIAHIALGHIIPGTILVDEEMSEDSYIFKDRDSDESAADRFASELLKGRENVTYTLADRANFMDLADTAYEFGKANQIDPGHIVLNFANQSGKWGMGIEAAKVLQGKNPPASEVITEAMWGGIDLEAIPTDTIEFLARVTGSDVVLR
ncbi:MAG: ImmA/IrrE family metallo-endopeptidase [Oscillatoriales cyanobacterium RU_3_3]|nr:ImmA/IrrE family metallo-endopeptidase [Oscillatoriales cyanobacterium RU_3_3]NJR22475.1 ImmA/IrrE family metallo-endopeptidase [Richelia sp. CSU_2_1]